MRIGLTASIVFHLIVAAWVLRGLTSAVTPAPSEMVAVDLVQVESVDKPKALSLPKPGPDSKNESKADSKTDPKVDAKSDPKTDGKTDPKAGAKTDPKTDKTDPKAGAKGDPKTDPKADPKTDPKVDPKTNASPAADKSPSGESAPLSRSLLEAAPALGAVPALSEEDIAALVGATGRIGSGGIVTSSLAGGLPREQIEALRAQVQRCWEIPGGWTNPRQASVTIRFRLKKDGTVDGQPVVTEFPASPIGKAASDTAVLAVKRCGPYQLPADSYDKWRVMELHLAAGQ